MSLRAPNAAAARGECPSTFCARDKKIFNSQAILMFPIGKTAEVDWSLIADQRAQFGALEHGADVICKAVHHDMTTDEPDTVAVINVSLTMHDR